MKFIKSKKGIAALAAVAVVAIAAVGAYAYWTASGTGTGHADVGTTADWVVTPTDVTPDTLYPGGPSYAVDGSVANTGSSNQQLNKITATIVAPSNVGTDGLKPACTAADFALSTVGTWVIDSPTSAHLDVYANVAPGGTHAWLALKVGMVNRLDTLNGDGLGNQDNCKGAKVNVKFDAS